MTEREYRLVVPASAERSLGRVPEGVAAAIVEFMLGALVDALAASGAHSSERSLVCGRRVADRTGSCTSWTTQGS